MEEQAFPQGFVTENAALFRQEDAILVLNLYADDAKSGCFGSKKPDILRLSQLRWQSRPIQIYEIPQNFSSTQK
jgi:hypothetical protein